MDDKLARLKEVGFMRAGHWKTLEDGILCELADLAGASNVLYAFAVDGQLMYIGKTVRPLRLRLAGYRKPGASQSTNIKNNGNIRDSLAQGKQVEVYVLPDNGLMHYGGFHLNLAAGLEDSLIRELEPSWNGGQKEGANQVLQPIEQQPTVLAGQVESGVVEPSPIATVNDFRAALYTMFAKAAEDGSHHIDVNAGQLHRRVGGYPGSDHRMPACCAVMRQTMNEGDLVLEQPPKGNGASLTIRYLLPREAS